MSRPGPADRGRIGAVILAAGRSRRFGRRNKLLAPLGGRPLWWRTLAAVCASRARPVVVVLPSRPRRMRRSLAEFRRGLRRPTRLTLVVNRGHARGLSTSIRAGLARLPADLVGAVLCLADMPRIEARLIDALIAAHQTEDAAVIPRHRGRRGNPVLLGRAAFADADRLRGDEGFRRLLAATPTVRIVETGAGVRVDVDTRRDHARMRRSPRPRLQMRRPRHPL